MRSTTLCALVCIAMGGVFAACEKSLPSELKAEARQTDVAYVRIPTRYLTKEFLAATGFNRDHRRDDVYAFGYLDRQALEQLPTAVFNDIVELDAKAWSHHDFDPRTLELRSDANEDTNVDVAEGFHDYAAMTTELQRIAGAFPEITTLESAGKSVEGRDLWLLKVSDNAATEEDEPKLLYIANMHGDETVGRELMIYLARLLTDQYGHDPRITNLVNSAQIYIMASMNPDGYEKEQRYNAEGVDLNRDFPDFSSDPHDTPAGRAPETQAIMALHARHHFIMSLNFHGGEVVFNVPWDTKANGSATERFGDDSLLQMAGRQYADTNATMHANTGGSFDRGLTYGYEWYEVNGGMQDWSIFYRNSIHATVELSYTKWPSAANLPAMWNENKEGLLKYLEQALVGAHVKIVDEARQPVRGATVRVSSAARDVSYASNVIHRPAIGAAQTLRISAAGYLPKDVSFTPNAFSGANYQEVMLSR